MTGYLSAFRPIVVLAGGLTLLGFKIAQGNLNGALLPALAVVIVATAAMAQNDYRDRFFDKVKGKTFIYDHSQKYLRYTIILWVMSFLLVLLLGFENFGFSFLVFFMAISGLIYSEIQKTPMLANILVALTSASAVLFPIFCNGVDTSNIWMVFLAAFCAIYAREILKDFEDSKIDTDKKWNPVVAWGKSISSKVAFCFLVMSIALLLNFRSALLGLPFLAWSSFLLLFTQGKKSISLIKWSLDIGMTLFLICTLIF